MQIVSCLASALFGILLCASDAGGQMLGDPAAGNSAGPPLSPPPPYVPPPGYAPPPSSGPPTQVGALPFAAIMASAYSQTAFTFDRTMLQLADGFFSGNDPETRRVLAGLNSITVRNYHAQDFARYDPGALAAIDGQLRGAGWKHLVNGNGKATANLMDLWLHFNGGNINNVTVLSRGDRNMSVVTVDCTLRPLDLLHLSGHFGIPKIDEGAVMVPAH
ncbi:MAG: hypothetical protein ACRYHB_10040 [Janthinobacterium lividum]